MWLAVVLTLISAAYLVGIVLVAAGLYKDPVLHQFERYAEIDDSFQLLPPLLLGLGLLAIFGGFLFSITVAPRYPSLVMGGMLIVLAWVARDNHTKMAERPHIFLLFPRWYADLRERTTREERRRIAYMWLSLPRSMRLHLNGSDRHFLIWADLVILATVTQTVEDQEAKADHMNYIPDLHGRYG